MILNLKNVSVTYKRDDGSSVVAVNSVSMSLKQGEILGLVGESGCGKSTLGKAIMGINPVSTGSIEFDGVQVKSLGRESRPLVLRQMQLIFQDPYSSLNPRRTIGNQLIDGLINAGDDEEKAREISAKLLERVGLSRNALTKYSHQFSGGQRQRIAIARALSISPKIIVADEPISALDASAQAQVSNLLVELVKEFNMGMIFISHDLSVVRQISDRIAVMYLGKIVELGDTEDIWKSPLHPYTNALINAVPRPDGKGYIPLELLGDVPDPRFPPNGCRFNPRCPKVFEICSKHEPHLVKQMGDTREVSCHLHNIEGSANVAS